MNTKTILMNVGNDINTLVVIPVVLCDEFGNVVYFSKNTTTSELTALQVDVFGFNEAVIEVVAPFTLVLNPSALQLPGKIYKIIYSFGDGNTDIQEYFYSDGTDLSLNHPNDIGDPRNYIKSNTYYLDDNVSKQYTLSVLMYELGNTLPTEYYIKLNISCPNLDGEVDGYFKNIHLISTKMFGKDDKILYTFESDEPNYILPALVKWEEDPKIIAKKNIIYEPPRIFDILLPFESDKTNSNETKQIAITYKDADKPNTKIVDLGNKNVKSIKN